MLTTDIPDNGKGGSTTKRRYWINSLWHSASYWRSQKIAGWSLKDMMSDLVSPLQRSVPSWIHQCSRIRILRFFRLKKTHDFLRFFEMTYQKVVKSR